MPIQTALFFARSATGAALWRALATAALFAASTYVQAASISLEVELADTSIAYLDESTQTTLWPQIWNHADLVAYYLPTEGIEGEAQKTRPRLQLFTCWVGTTCIPAPRFEMESSLIVHKVTAKAQVLQGAAGQPLKLRFELPEAPAPHYYFSHSELRAPANALWRVPMFAGWDRELSSDGRRRFAWQRKQPLSIALVLAEKDTVGYQLVDLGVRTPGQLDHYGDPLAATTMRASLSGPDGRVRQLSWPGELSQELSQRLLASPDLARTGRIPADLKRNQFPERLSSFHAKERISTVVMPSSTPRWHGLKHYNASEGVLLVLMQSGPIAQVELMAEAGTERAIEGNVPVKRETWMFFNGKPMRYRGQMQYGNNADHMPDTKWRVDWVDGVRLDAMAANVSPSFLVKRVPDCRWQGCRDNLAEAKAQLAASDAQLQSEGERYLRLAREGN